MAAMKNNNMKLRSTTCSKCSVFSCPNSLKATHIKRPTLSYYPFPKDEILCESWKQFCNKADNDYENAYVCSDHFTPNDFISPCDKPDIDRKNRLLKMNAIPTIYKPEFKFEESSMSNISSMHRFGDIQCKTSDLSMPKEDKYCCGKSCSGQVQCRSGANGYSKKSHSRGITNDTQSGAPHKEKFVRLLKDHSVLFDTSVAANVRFRKARALKNLAFDYRRKFGKVITRYSLRKKIDSMVNYIRTKLNRIKKTTNRQIRLKKWEDDFVKLLQSKGVLISTVAYDVEEEPCRAVIPYNHNLPGIALKSLTECTTRNSELSAETDETEGLSGDQLQRLLNLELLKLIRLQQIRSEREIERMKVMETTTGPAKKK